MPLRNAAPNLVKTILNDSDVVDVLYYLKKDSETTKPISLIGTLTEQIPSLANQVWDFFSEDGQLKKLGIDSNLKYTIIRLQHFQEQSWSWNFVLLHQYKKITPQKKALWFSALTYLTNQYQYPLLGFDANFFEISHDAHLNITGYSKALQNALGCESETYLKTPLFDVIQVVQMPLEFSSYFGQLFRLENGDISKTFRLRDIKKEGENTTYVLEDATQIRRGWERLTSQYKNAIHNLKTNQRALQKVMEIGKLAPFIYKLEQNKVFLSKEAKQVLQVNQDSIDLQELKKMTLANDWKKSKEKFFDALEGNSLNTDLGLFIDKRLVILNVQGFWLYDKEEQPFELHGFFQDISKRRQGEQEMLLAKLGEERASKIKEVFLANISHEIRTPLNAIVGFLELLSKQVTGTDGKYYLELINESTQSLLSLINDVLDFTKMEASKEIILKKTFNLHDLLVYVAEIYYPKKTAELDFSLELKDNIPEFIIGDPERLKQILINPLNNAFHHTKNGKISLIVELAQAIKKDHASVKFIVKDSGSGIPTEVIEKIFEPFYQVANHQNQKKHGAGIGLAIVKKLVEAYDGTIKIDSMPNEGTTVEITISFPIAHDAPNQNKSNVFSIPILNQHKILIVEDNMTNQVLLREILKKTQCEIHFAENGLEAIKKLETGGFTFVLMDFQMPIMDGIEATKYIRNSNAYFADIPILGVTANTWENDIQFALDIGMNDTISKPFKQEAFFNKLSALLEHEKSQQTPETSITLDKSLIESLLGPDMEVQQNFIGVARSEIIETFQDIQNHLDKGDLKIAGQLHKLKGIFGYLSENMRKLVADLEHKTKQESLSEKDLREAIRGIQIKSEKLFQ